MFDIDDDTTQTVTLVSGGDPTDIPANLGRVGTVEASPAEMDKIFGTDLAGGDPLGHEPGPDRRDQATWVHPIKLEAQRRLARQRRPNPFELRRLAGALTIEWPAPPETVILAQSAGRKAVTKAEDAARAIESVPDDRELQAAKHSAAVEKAFSEDRNIPAPPKTDWIAQEAILRATYTQAIKAAEVAVTEFREAVELAETEWRAALVAEVGPAWDEFQAAVRVVAKAGRRWSSSKAGAHRMSLDLGVFKPDTHRTSAPRTLESHAMAGLTALVALVDADDPVLSGAYLAEGIDPGSVPPHTLEAMRRNAAHNPGGADWHAVAELDAATARN